MAETMGIENLILGTMAGAVVVLAGAFYALFFALGKLQSSRAFLLASLLSYGLLVAAVWVLAVNLKLSGFWIVVTATMLVGYFMAPRAIWHLCVGTHADDAGTLNEESIR